MLYDNVENTNQRDSNMIHTIRNMTKEDSVIMNVYVRECDSNGVRSKNKGVFNVDIDENIKMIKKEKEDPKVEELENPYETFTSVLDAFEKGVVTKFWGGIKSFKYSFRGDFEYLNKCVLKHIELKKAGKGLTKEVMEKEYVFDEFNPVVTENVVSKEMIELYQEYYRKTIADGVWGLGDRQANRYKQNNEPFSRFLHYEILPLIERITGEKLRPTYTYLSSILVSLIILIIYYILKLVMVFLDTYALKIVLVIKTAVNILIRIPQKSTVANPLIGPVPI